MTEMNKYRIRKHIAKYDVAYLMVAFMGGVLLLLALEAKGILS
jgi:hypothetical protein